MRLMLIALALLVSGCGNAANDAADTARVANNNARQALAEANSGADRLEALERENRELKSQIAGLVAGQNELERAHNELSRLVSSNANVFNEHLDRTGR